MLCSSCGAEVETDADVCDRCGAKNHADPRTGSGTSPRGGQDFVLEASPLELFARYAVLAIAGTFVLPLPWVTAWFAKWFAGSVRSHEGEPLQFLGAARGLFLPVVLCLLAYVIYWFAYSLDGSESGSFIAVAASQALVYSALIGYNWALIKWVIGNLQFHGRTWQLEGKFLGYLGWYIVFVLSTFTVIGWAWVFSAWCRWFAKNTSGTGGQIVFRGAGLEILWRTVAFCVFSIPFVTLPWAAHWYYKWFVGQVALVVESDQPDPAGVVV